jgi:hypothetical protein
LMFLFFCVYIYFCDIAPDPPPPPPPWRIRSWHTHLARTGPFAVPLGRILGMR